MKQQRQAGACAPGRAEQLCRVPAASWDAGMDGDGCRIASPHRWSSGSRVCYPHPCWEPAVPECTGKGEKRNSLLQRPVCVHHTRESWVGMGDLWGWMQDCISPQMVLEQPGLLVLTCVGNQRRLSAQGRGRRESHCCKGLCVLIIGWEWDICELPAGKGLKFLIAFLLSQEKFDLCLFFTSD